MRSGLISFLYYGTRNESSQQQTINFLRHDWGLMLPYKRVWQTHTDNRRYHPSIFRKCPNWWQNETKESVGVHATVLPPALPIISIYSIRGRGKWWYLWTRIYSTDYIYPYFYRTQSWRHIRFQVLPLPLLISFLKEWFILLKCIIKSS